MKKLTNDELFILGYKYLEKNKNHSTASVIIALFSVVQTGFFIFGVINFIPFLMISILTYGLSYFHMKIAKKSLDKVDEILKEFDSRIENKKT